jgi:protein ImuB
MLFACIHVPDFLVQAALRAELNAASMADAVALLDGPESLLKVVACNAPARRAGITLGMTKLEAEVCLGVVLRKRAVEEEESAQAALLDCGYSFSPRVESTSPGTIIFDLTGSERLWSAAQVGPLLLERARTLGFEANAGIAANPDTALCAARGFPGITVIAPGNEAACLGCLPVAVLESTPETLDTFDAWGLRDLKSLAALPAVPLTQRLGQYGLHLQRLAQGEVQRELVPAELPAVFHESMELEEAVELLEPLSFLLNRLLEQLTSRLQARSLATDLVHVDLSLEIHSDRDLRAAVPVPAGSIASLHQRTLKLPVPTQDAKVLLKLLQLDLAAHPPQAPVKKIRMEAVPARIRLTQTGLFQPLAPEAARLEITLGRLRAVVGETDTEGRGRVGFPVTVDSHRPDSFQVASTTPEHVQPKNSETHELMSASCVALRLFRPPLAASVQLKDGRPVAVKFHHRQAEILHAAGPWRSSGAWWDENENWNRDEWDVNLCLDGTAGLYRVYRDLLTGRWFVEGMYD